MYAQEFDNNLLFQGDVIKDLPFFISPEQNYVQHQGESQEESSRNFFKTDPQLTPALKYVRTGIIVSQNCDIDNKEFVLIAPVFEISERYSSNPNHVISLKQQKATCELYLPSKDDFPDSLADLQLIAPIKRSMIDIGNRLFVLSDYGRALLQEHLRIFLGRIEVKPYDEND